MITNYHRLPWICGSRRYATDKSTSIVFIEFLTDGIFDHPQAADFWQVTHLESFNQQQRCRNNKSAVQLLQEGCIVLVVQRSHPAGDGIGPCGWVYVHHEVWGVFDDLLDESFEGSCHVLSNVFLLTGTYEYMIYEYNFNQNSQNEFVVSIIISMFDLGNFVVVFSRRSRWVRVDWKHQLAL